jgi:Flp pilus assembly secretin CpaC
MKGVGIACCLALTVATSLFGQSPSDQPYRATDSQGFVVPARLQELRQAVRNLEDSGKANEAAAVRQQYEQECQALLKQYCKTPAEAAQIRHVLGIDTQVRTRLHVFEVSLTKLKAIHYDLKGILRDPGQPAEAAFSIHDGKDVEQFFDQLKKNHLVKILAEPTMLVASGKRGSIGFGQEISVPKKQEDGSLLVEQQPQHTVEVIADTFGNRVDFQIQCKIREPHPEHSCQVGRYTIPAIGSRGFGTSAHLESGQTLVFNGLVESRMESENHGLPWISEIPYVGAIFRTVKENRNEIMLCVFVQPEILDAAPGQPNANGQSSRARADNLASPR